MKRAVVVTGDDGGGRLGRRGDACVSVRHGSDPGQLFGAGDRRARRGEDRAVAGRAGEGTAEGPASTRICGRRRGRVQVRALARAATARDVFVEREATPELLWALVRRQKYVCQLASETGAERLARVEVELLRNARSREVARAVLAREAGVPGGAAGLRAAALHARTGEIASILPAFLVLDDCLADGWVRFPGARYAVMNGRCCKLMLLVSLAIGEGTSSSPVIPPALRMNVDYVFLFHERDPERLRLLYDNYASWCFPTLDAFARAMERHCEDQHSCLVISRYDVVRGYNVVSWYRATLA